MKLWQEPDTRSDLDVQTLKPEVVRIVDRALETVKNPQMFRPDDQYTRYLSWWTWNLLDQVKHLKEGADGELFNMLLNYLHERQH